MLLRDRVVFITGASRGIGRAVALACAKQGAHVVIAAKTEVAENPKLPGTIHDVAREVEALGTQALPLKLDVRDDAACEAAIQRTVDHFGRIDALVNNAGALYWADVADNMIAHALTHHGLDIAERLALTEAAMFYSRGAA